METVKSKSYTLRSENGGRLGQVVITSDGMFASVTDWGNLSYSWRSFGEDFRAFLTSINTSYFAGKLYAGIAYTASGRKVEQSCARYAERILPALQKVLKEELERGGEF